MAAIDQTIEEKGGWPGRLCADQELNSGVVFECEACYKFST